MEGENYLIFFSESSNEVSASTRFLALFYSDILKALALTTYSIPGPTTPPGMVSYTMNEGTWYFVYVSTNSVDTALFVLFV